MKFPRQFLYDESTCPSIVNLKLKAGAPIAPCPFCRGYKIELQNTWTPSYWLECQKCEAQVGDQKNGRADNKTGHTLSALNAIEAWNKRA